MNTQPYQYFSGCIKLTPGMHSQMKEGEEIVFAKSLQRFFGLNKSEMVNAVVAVHAEYNENRTVSYCCVEFDFPMLLEYECDGPLLDCEGFHLLGLWNESEFDRLEIRLLFVLKKLFFIKPEDASIELRIEDPEDSATRFVEEAVQEKQREEFPFFERFRR